MKKELSQGQSSIAPRDLQRRLADGGLVHLIDVRTPGEFAAGHVPGARLIPLADLNPAEFHSSGGDAGPLYVLCQSGPRARKAIARLEEAGATNCVLVEGGTQGWMDAGLPVERSKTAGLPLMRQVQIVVGSFTGLGAVLALTASPYLLPGSAGHGLRVVVRGTDGNVRLGVVIGENAMESGARIPHSLCGQLHGGGMKRPLRIVIVGGVAGGASAAAKARRVNESAEIEIFDRGPYISFANCGLPYFIAGEIADRSRLIVMTPEAFWERSRVRAHVNHEVISINRAAKSITVKDSAGQTREVPYDKLILSQGARPIIAPITGADLPHVFTLRDIPDMDRIAALINQSSPKHAVIIGGGFIGLEMAEAFHRRGMKVTVVERNPHILPLLDRDMGAYLQRQLRRDDFRFKTGVTASRFTPEEVEFSDGSRLPADLILMSVGIQAEVELARAAGLTIGETGGVKTNGRLESSDPNIYAVGDAAETTHALTGARSRIALAGPANRQGRIAGANAAGAHLIYPGALGTSIVRVLHMTAGFTGLNSAQASKAGFTFFTSVTRDFSNAHYYPGAKPVLIKIIAEDGTGRLLGAQVLGERGIDKRVDVLATAITAKMSVFDLETLDLAYSPPFGSANDPVNTAGFVASHIARGDVATVAPEAWKPNGDFLLDVRDPDEVAEFGKIDGAMNIPLAQVRDSLDKLPRDQSIVTYCQKGQRGYLAACALAGRGFYNVANLRGGFLEYQLFNPSPE